MRVDPPPCALSAGTGVDHSMLEPSSPSEAESMDLAMRLEQALGGPAVSDPYLMASEPCLNETELVGAEGDQPLLQPSSSPNLEWADFSVPGALGRSLAVGVASGVFPKGMEEFFKAVQHNASTDAFTRRRGLFPLPVDFSKIAPCSSDTEMASLEVTAWCNLVSLALNRLAGWHGPYPAQRKGRQSDRAVQGIRDRAERFLRLFTGEPMNALKLWDELKQKRISYDGEEFSEPVPLTRDQILRSLPPAGHGGSVDLAPLLVGRARFLLQNPSSNLLEADEREPGANSACVHIALGEELEVWQLLQDRGVIEWLPLSEVHKDAQGHFLSGMFGVEKPNKLSPGGRPLLRVIMNLQPINRVLRIIQGDIKELPMATSWTQLFLQESETIHVSQADMSSAFYLFRLPAAWRPFLCFNSKMDGARIGRRPGITYVPSCIVLPMGWSSSVGLMQMASREMIRRNATLTATELRRQMAAPAWFVDMIRSAEGRCFWQVYLDNYMAGEVGPKQSSGSSSIALHEEAVEIWNKEGVLCAPDKHVYASNNAIELGVALNGTEGLVGGGPTRFHQLLIVTLMLLGQRNPKVKWVQIVLGRWIFVLQYRRPAMAILSRCWNYIRKDQDRRRWWPVVQHELSMLICMYHCCTSTWGWSFRRWWHAQMLPTTGGRWPCRRSWPALAAPSVNGRRTPWWNHTKQSFWWFRHLMG